MSESDPVEAGSERGILVQTMYGRSNIREQGLDGSRVGQGDKGKQKRTLSWRLELPSHPGGSSGVRIAPQN